MGYRTPNEDIHECVYCGVPVLVGEGVLLKYAPSQSDKDIKLFHLTDRIAHITCINIYGESFEKEALKP